MERICQRNGISLKYIMARDRSIDADIGSDTEPYALLQLYIDVVC